MRPQPRAPGPRLTTTVVATLVLMFPALVGCGNRGATPELRTGASPEVCALDGALDGAADDSPATSGFIVAHDGTPDDAAVDAELAWVADETGTTLTRERLLATGAVLLRAERPIGGRERVDLLCALERLAAVRYAEPDAVAFAS